MKQSLRRRIAKSSVSIPENSYHNIIKKLHSVRQLIKESSHVAQELSLVVQRYRYLVLSINNKLQTEQNSSNKKEKYFEWQHYIYKEIDSNLLNLNDILGKSDDIVFREFKIGIKIQIRAFICFIDGLVDKKIIDEYIIKPLLFHIQLMDQDDYLLTHDIFNNLKDHVFNAIEVREEQVFDEVLDAVLNGDTILFIDGYDKVLIVNAKGGETRAIQEPETEVVVRGSREGFVESLRVNTSLLRRKIKNPNLIMESFRLGKQTHTDISIAYITGIANKKIVEEVKNRLNKINTDAPILSGEIEQFIEDAPLSFFSTIGNSERPDKVIAKILEGRIAIIVNGTPFVLTIPHLFIENFQVSEDYSDRAFFVTFIRIIRMLAFFVTLTLPALYVAVETYHQDMIPSVLLITAAAAREGIPFPSFVETLIMLLAFELLRESGLRLPRQVGQAVSIVGTLVVGEAAVRAGIVSAPMVIIGAITGITSFIIPSILSAVIFFRFFLLFLSAAFGLYGIVVGMIMMLAHICSLRSFGMPYLAPFAPLIWKDLQDSIIRVPIWLMKTRPKSITWRYSKRQGDSAKPHAP